ncbi:MAG TPA: UDP-N-acetylmuramoyl-tripeptide--D-alanyl-D-alanine ligase [Caulobacteraceae bacterium]|nr:UDP-N-acetylmuramoyl-tripeptide--D-alanyl-D-alanine ligase [Caulobacteraceae bacterium]
MKPLWTSAEIAAATGGRAYGPAFAAGGVSIDSRTLEDGDLFVALTADRDGHAFVPAAFAAGAAGALVCRPADRPSIVVEDTLEALRRLGAAARARSMARIGAITGSVGKTGVTQAVLATLRRAGAAHGSTQSYNNHIGVPLTLARMPAEVERAVFEIGMNHAGEIAPLSALARPHAVAITTVGAVHTENFADGEAGVARAKAEIFTGLQAGGAAVLDADSHWFGFLSDQAERARARVRTFGRSDRADARLISAEPSARGLVVEAAVDGAPLRLELLQNGAHWGLMCLCALLMACALGVDQDTAAAALAGFAPLAGRGAVRRIGVAGGCATLIDDSYNANPLSVRAALVSLGERRGAGRRIAVLTDMLELGEGALEAHVALAGPIEEARVDLVFCAGPLMAGLFETLPPSRRGAWAAHAAELEIALEGALTAGDAILVKGSKGSKAHEIAAALMRRGEG